MEVIGDFGKFKRDIRNLAGINSATAEDTALSNLVRNKKLFIELESDAPPTQRLEYPGVFYHIIVL